MKIIHVMQFYSFKPSLHCMAISPIIVCKHPVPSVKEAELALAILFSMGEVSFEAIAGGEGHCAKTMRLTIVIQWT